jgi:uncharacterized protein YkwD
MKRISFFSLLVLAFTLACSITGISTPAPIPTMDLARIPTMVVETANALATANTVTPVPTIPTDTPIVITATSSETATSTETSTASPTSAPSSTATPITFTVSPTNTSISATNFPTATLASIKSTATNVPPATAPPLAATAVPQAPVPSTAIPPTPIPPTAVPPTVESICPVTNASYESRVIELINAERAKVGLSALSTQGQLGSAARLHSTDMACNNYFSHTGLDGSNSADRAQRQGYSSGFVGENIAAGYSSPANVVQGWMKSPGHKANMLSPEYTEIGVGYAFGDASDYGLYWTAVFASP